MFCRNCGKKIDDKAVICVKCGVKANDGEAFCQSCGKETQPGAVVCVSCGSQLALSQADVKGKAGIKIAAGICGILLGCLGVHKFILGYTGPGLILLLVTVLTCGAGAAVTAVIGLIEGIIYLVKPDEEFVRTYVDNERPWF